jgi:hypothetical protein
MRDTHDPSDQSRLSALVRSRALTKAVVARKTVGSATVVRTQHLPRHKAPGQRLFRWCRARESGNDAPPRRLASRRIVSAGQRRRRWIRVSGQCRGAENTRKRSSLITARILAPPRESARQARRRRTGMRPDGSGPPGRRHGSGPQSGRSAARARSACRRCRPLPSSGVTGVAALERAVLAASVTDRADRLPVRPAPIGALRGTFIRDVSRL